jgi:hypothetical protein
VFDLVCCINIGKSGLPALYSWAPAKSHSGTRCFVGHLEKQRNKRHLKNQNLAPETNYTTRHVYAAVGDALRTLACDHGI